MFISYICLNAVFYLSILLVSVIKWCPLYVLMCTMIDSDGLFWWLGFTWKRSYWVFIWGCGRFRGKHYPSSGNCRSPGMLGCKWSLDLISGKRIFCLIFEFLLLQADIESLKAAICSAVDVMQAMGSSICSLLSGVRFLLMRLYFTYTVMHDANFAFLCLYSSLNIFSIKYLLVLYGVRHAVLTPLWSFFVNYHYGSTFIYFHLSFFY